MIRDLVVELVTPAMVGGAGKGCDEPATLRPPSLRGQLRFWSRALGGGGESGQRLETWLWGDLEAGQRVRLLGAQELPAPREAYLFPHKEGRAKSPSRMVAPGARSLLRFGIPGGDLLASLQAVAWVWLHLGTVGRRSRRGYGSLLWEPHPGHLLDGFLAEPLVPSKDLRDKATLTSYLERGLDRAWSAVDVASEPERQGSEEFVLRSLDQVFLGDPISDRSWHVAGGGRQPGPSSVSGSYEYLLHGLAEGKRGGDAERQQFGLPEPRLPSPMALRLLPCTAGGDFAVMTWSPYRYAADIQPRIGRDTGLYRLLHDDLKFDSSLAGQPLFAEPS
jgi:RAMP superfamily